MDSMFKSREQEQVKASNPMGLSRTEIKLDVNKDPDAEALKMLKRPHSKKYMKALSIIDSLSENDERIIAELKKNAGIAEDADATFTEEDISAFRAKVSQTIKEEQDSLYINEVFAQCSIEGCVVHNFNSEGDILNHYSASEVSAFDKVRLFAARQIIENNAWEADISNNAVVTRNSYGDVIQIIKASDVLGS